MKKEKQSTKIVKEKKKLTKIQIVKIVMASISAVMLVLAIVFTCIKTPIDGSIYCINTTLEEREAVWEQKQDELFDYYDSTYPASHYENRMETSRWLKILYKISYSNETSTTKQLNLEIINFTNKSIRFKGSIYIKHRESNQYLYIHDTQNVTFSTRESNSYSLTVDTNFNIDDYFMYANIDDGGVLSGDRQILESYERELERTKTFSIYDDIEAQIGAKPTNESESTEPIPDYMVEIMNARMRFMLFYVFAGLFLFLAIVIHKPKHTHHTAFATDFTITPRPEPKTEIIIKEIHHTPKVKKVTCLYCGSRYKDNLDECPNCGSAKIKPEQKIEE